ncbi:TPA: hypothetical protein JI173_00060 [Acinetobacter baumannii]|nr:hypothetical protein [Acinetobacter baumannii]
MTLYDCSVNGCRVKLCEDNGENPCFFGDTYEECKNIKCVNQDEALAYQKQVCIEEELNFKNIFFMGNSLKFEEIKYLALEDNPRIITLIGLPNVGKTSLLVSFIYALRMNNKFDLKFKGSITLNGWKDLINYTYYAYGETPQHPERTIDKLNTEYLHILVKDCDKTIDLLFGDTAGELFSALLDEVPDDSQEIIKITQWITESQILLLCLDSSEYYTENLWLSKDNHTRFIDKLSVLIEKYNPNIKIIFIETKNDIINEESENYQYHQEVNEYLFEKLSNNIIDSFKTVSITAKQGVFPQSVDEILNSCINVYKNSINREKIIGCEETIKNTYNYLGEWI